MRTVLAACILSAVAAGRPQLHPDLHGQSTELITAMRELSRDYYEPPGLHGNCTAGRWISGVRTEESPPPERRASHHRDLLHLDHDVVDGAPMARFGNALMTLIEQGYGLPAGE